MKRITVVEDTNPWKRKYAWLKIWGVEAITHNTFNTKIKHTLWFEFYWYKKEWVENEEYDYIILYRYDNKGKMDDTVTFGKKVIIDVFLY